MSCSIQKMKVQTQGALHLQIWGILQKRYDTWVGRPIPFLSLFHRSNKWRGMIHEKAEFFPSPGFTTAFAKDT